MNQYKQDIQIRWSDLDPNFHIRHSVYYDWGAFVRIAFLDQFGLTAAAMFQLQIGPILFREECIFRKEVRLGDSAAIDLHVLKARRDYSRWSIQHQIYKEGEIIAATLQVDGAWMHVRERKLTTPSHEVFEVFDQMPKAANFEWM
jgi:acyl-CoA thioester hydrolase